MSLGYQWLKSCLFLIAGTCSMASIQAEDPAAWSWQDRWVTSLAPAPEGKLVASLATGLPYREGAVVRFALDQPEQVQELYKQPSAVWAVATSPDMARLASTDYQGSLVVASLTGELNPKTFDKAFGRWTRALAFSNDGKQLAAGNEAGVVFVWDVEGGQSPANRDLASGQILSLAFAPSGSRIAVTTGSGKLHVLNWPSLEPVKEVALGDQPLWSVAFAGSDEVLWTGSADGKVRRVPAEGDPVEVGKLNDWVTSLAPLPGGGVVAISLRGQIKKAPQADSAALVDWASGPQGLWDVMPVAGEQLVVATRKAGPAIFQTVGQLKYSAKESSESKPETK